MRQIRLLSVRQPWAWALIHGGKDVENRSWSTHYRGLLAIHAGLALDMNQRELREMHQGDYDEPYTSMIRAFMGNREDGRIVKNLENDIRGTIIGVVELVACLPDVQCDSPWKAGGEDFYCWQVQKPVALETHIPYKGMLGLRPLPEHLETILRDAWLEAWPDPS